MSSSAPLDRLVRAPSGASAAQRPRGRLDQASCFLLLALPTLAVLGPYASLSPGSAGQIYLYRLSVLVAAPLAIFLALRRATMAGLARSTFSVLAGLYLVWAPVTLLWTPNKALGRTDLVATAAAALSAWAAASLAGWSRRHLRAFTVGWLVAFGVAGAVGLWESASGQRFLASSGRMSWPFAKGTIASTFANPNNFAVFLVLWIALLLVVAHRVSTTWQAIGSSVALTAATYLLWATGSRGGMLGAVAIAVGCLGWYALTRRRWQAVVSVVVVVLLLAGARFTPTLLVPAFSQTTPSAPTAAPRPGKPTPPPTDQPAGPTAVGPSAEELAEAANADSDQRRLQLLAKGLHYVQEQPLRGHGIGSMGALLRADPDWSAIRTRALHNSILETAVELGAPAGLVLVLFLGCLIVLPVRALWRSRRSLDPDAAAGPVLAVLLIVPVLMFVLVVSTISGDPAIWLVFGYAAAVVGQLACTGRTRRGTADNAD